jgi:hypothetical protein
MTASLARLDFLARAAGPVISKPPAGGITGHPRQTAPDRLRGGLALLVI